MTLLAALVVAILFASGTFLLLQRDLLRVVVGILLISNSATLFIIVSGLSRGQPPIYPLADGPVSDPLVQAMALTALIIGFGISALLLAMVYRLYLSNRSIDVETIARTERRQAVVLDRSANPEQEEVPGEDLDAEKPREEAGPFHKGSGDRPKRKFVNP
jgi:multicomponent Na+:H+ antiporter subunit C